MRISDWSADVCSSDLLIMTHLPAYAVSCGLPAMTGATALSLIGLFNLIGTTVAGALGARYRTKYLLSGIYATRSVVIAAYLILPVHPVSTQVFAAARSKARTVGKEGVSPFRSR